MKTATGFSLRPEAHLAVKEALSMLSQRLNAPLSMVVVSCTVQHQVAEINRLLREALPGVPLFGCTSCSGIMTEDGHHLGEGWTLALLGLSDPAGAFGVAAASLEQGAQQAGAEAVRQALLQADRPYELPGMVWLTTAPGHEEQVLQGILSELGESARISGGSAADNDLSGQWAQFCQGQIYGQAAVTAVLFPSSEVVSIFQNGYEPNAHSAQITRAEGRCVHTLDGKPAAEVYNAWTGGLIQAELENAGPVHAITTLKPLGRQMGEIGGVPQYLLSLPERVTPEHGLTLLTEVQEGERLYLMEGQLETLVTRAGRVATGALRAHNLTPQDLAGALIVFCYSSMLAIGPQMTGVAEAVRQALGGKPFMGMFTFGEQGCFPNGRNHHGNLMISITLLTV